MKSSLLTLTATVASVAAAFSTVTASASVLYQTNFDTPPYDLNQSAHGQEGWQIFSQVGNLDDGRIVDTPWGSTGLFLKSNATPGNAAWSIARYDFSTPITAPLIQIDLVMAFTSSSKADNPLNSRIMFGSSEDNSPITVGFNRSATGGIYYIGSSGTNITVLEKADVKYDSPYTFSIILDMENKVSTLTITGVRQDDSVYTQTIEDIGFRNSSFSGIDMIRMAQNHTQVSGYLDSISIQAIPEPSTTAALMVGGGALALSALRKRRR